MVKDDLAAGCIRFDIKSATPKSEKDRRFANQVDLNQEQGGGS